MKSNKTIVMRTQWWAWWHKMIDIWSYILYDICNIDISYWYDLSEVDWYWPIYVMIILNLRIMLKRKAPFKFFLPGHCWSLHAWVCVKSSVENSQPVKHDLDLVISPPPQNVEQDDQSLHNDNWIPIDMSFIASNMV